MSTCSLSMPRCQIAINALIFLVVLASCKKKVDNPVNTSNGPFIIATLDGVDQWKSSTQGGLDINDTLAIGGEATDGSYIYIYFSDSKLVQTPLNTPFSPLSLDFKYILGPDDVYSSTTPGGSASVTLTLYDPTKRSIAGYFSGTVVHPLVSGSDEQQITKGQFYVKY